MPSQDKPIKCRRCKLTAQVVVEDDKPKTVTCLGCGITRDYSEVRRMLGEQATAFAAKKLQEALKRGLPKGRSGGVTFSHRPAHISQPKGDFFIELE